MALEPLDSLIETCHWSFGQKFGGLMEMSLSDFWRIRHW